MLKHLLPMALIVSFAVWMESRSDHDHFHPATMDGAATMLHH